MMSNKYKKYISYFQRVQTVGVLSCGKEYEEAVREAVALAKEDPISRCFYDETGWELSDTVEYDPDIEISDVNPSADGKSIEMNFNFNRKTIASIAEHLGKNICELTSSDLNEVIKASIKNATDKASK